jgi:signal-transduction protein with cAMP-binding, CBS, and nucleotidyltransferase domain
MSALAEIMCKQLKTVPGDTLVIDAAQKMRDEHIGSLLIEKDGKLVGIVTDTDIVRRAVANNLDLTQVRLESIMTSPLATIETTRNPQDAQDLMADLGIRHLVVQEAGKTAGLVSVRDLLVYYQSVSEPKIGQD